MFSENCLEKLFILLKTKKNRPVYDIIMHYTVARGDGKKRFSRDKINIYIYIIQTRLYTQ